jgi:hypothetical protein
MSRPNAPANRFFDPGERAPRDLHVLDKSMELPLSQLIYAKFRDTADPRRLITLHRYNEFLDTMREIGLAANPGGTVLGLQASKGVYLSRTVTGYSWFVGPLDQPSPVHFGDAMQEIERFLWDEIDRQRSDTPVRPFLVGAEQGGIMALAVAAAVPDLLSGVVAIDARFPVVPGWEPPLAPLDSLPILLVTPRPDEQHSGGVLGGDAIAATFNRWGGVITTLNEATGEVPANRIAEWVAQQPVRVMQK